LNNFSKGEDQFFIIGCQRSGATLLELILNSHPNIQIIGDPNIFGRRYQIKEDIKLFGHKTLDLTHRYYFFKERYPRAKFLFLVRNVKSLISSILNFYSWEFISRKIEESFWYISSSKFRRNLLEEFRGTKGDKLLELAFYIHNMFYIYEEYKREKLDILFIKYEHLIKNSQKEITRILNFLNLSWHSNTLKHHFFHKGVFNNGIDSQRSLDSSSLYLWKDKFTQNEINRIDNYLIYLKRLYN